MTDDNLMGMGANEPICDQPDCPGTSKLREYVVGCLPESEIEWVDGRAVECSQCRETLSHLEDSTDPVIRKLRDAARQEGVLDENELQELIRQADQLGAELTTLGKSSDDTLPPDGEALPDEIGQYRILEQIGSGGMGTVFRAEHLKLKKQVALKLLPDRQAGNDRAIQRFLREMEAIGRLEHPNIVRATDAGEDRGRHFLVMELVDGVDLSNLLRRRGRLPVAEASEIIRQAALGLQAAHEHDIIHRDVKPSNLMLSSSGEIRLLDLGLVQLQVESEEMPLSSESQIVGTLDYIAPEQVTPRIPVDHRADVYGLGCTFYTLLVGKPPFHGEFFQEPLQKIAAHANQPVQSIRREREEVPEEVAQILSEMLAKKPADRPMSPAEVAERLAPWTKGANLVGLLNQEAEASREMEKDQGAAEEPNDTSATKNRPKSRKIWLTGFVLLAVLGGAGWFLAPVVLRITTPEGTLVVEMDSDDFIAEIKGEQLLIQERGTDQTYKLQLGQEETSKTLPEGKYLVVTDNQGLRVEPTEFTLSRDNKVRVRVQIAHPERMPPIQAPEQSATGNIKIPPMKVRNFADKTFNHEAPDIKRGYGDGVHYMWVAKGKSGAWAWNTQRSDAGTFEVIARVCEDHAGACLVNFTNRKAEAGVSIRVDHRGELTVGPSIFKNKLDVSFDRPPLKHPKIKPAGEFSRLRFVMKRRSIDIYSDGERLGRTIELDFDLAPVVVALGIIGGGEHGPARVEFQRFVVWPTTEIDRIAPVEDGAKEKSGP